VAAGRHSVLSQVFTDVTVTHAPYHVIRVSPSATVKNDLAPGWCLLPLATLNNNSSSLDLLLAVKALATYWPVLPLSADDLQKHSRSSCNSSRIDGHGTLTFRAYVEHMTLWVSKVKRSKGRKQKTTQSLLTKAPHFRDRKSSQHQTQWKYSKYRYYNNRKWSNQMHRK